MSLHPNYQRWADEGRKRDPLVRTTGKPNAHHIPPTTDLDLVHVNQDGSAVISLRSQEGVLLDGEWEFILPKKVKES